MLECKSMYFGGEIISALDLGLDYDSYREMGLLCPFCNEPVYLCGETVRQNSKTGRLSYIQPHFKHFPGGDPTDFDCEKRYLSPEGKRYLDALRSDRKGQRLDLFNRYLWDMVRDGGIKTPGAQNVPDSAIRPLKRSGLNMDAFERESKLLHQEFKTATHAMQEYADYFLNEMINPESEWRKTGIGVRNTENLTEKELLQLKAIQESRIEHLAMTIEKRLTLLIVCECLEFLSTRQGYLAFREMFAWLIYELKVMCRKEKFELENKESLMKMVIMLVYTPWQQQLEEKAKLKELTRSKGFGRK